MPTDDVMLGPVSKSCEIIAQMMAENFLATNVKLPELLIDVEELLTAVDIAISQNNLPNDSDWETMRRCWCFFGPGLFKRVETLKELTALPQLTEKLRKVAYANTALVQTVLTIRRQTLELNGIEVFE